MATTAGKTAGTDDKFIQLAVDGGHLYALDAAGVVWKYSGGPQDGWTPFPTKRSQTA